MAQEFNDLLLHIRRKHRICAQTSGKESQGYPFFAKLSTAFF
jgi:hypothetical protein